MIYAKIIKAKNPKYNPKPKYIGYRIQLRIYTHEHNGSYDVFPPHAICSNVYKTKEQAQQTAIEHGYKLVTTWIDAQLHAKARMFR
jgi:hypothetical protein